MKENRYHISSISKYIVLWVITFTLSVATVSLYAEDASWVSTSNNTFAAELYSKLSRDGSENLFFSPYSITTALAMTYAGAQGETATAMERTLHLPKGHPNLHAEVGTFITELNKPSDKSGKPKGYELSVANALWGEKSAVFLPDFLKLLQESYGSKLQQLDFKFNPESARLEINKWVKERTKSKIQNLIAPGVITTDTKLVLTNAIYFKGSWINAFESRATKSEQFKISKDSTKSVSMMHQTEYFEYLESPSLQMVKLPYKGGDLEMVIALPKSNVFKATLVPEFISNLSEQSWKTERVILSLPKFSATSSFELSDALSKLGMAQAFSDTANFSGMSGKQELKISKVIHKAFVDVNETGSEAAAATAVVMMREMASIIPPSESKIFKADHPFLFGIRDRKSGAILFMGDIQDPSKS